MNLVKALLSVSTTCAVNAKAGTRAGAGFDKRAASRLIKSLGDKVGDKKLREPCEALLGALTGE